MGIIGFLSTYITIVTHPSHLYVLVHIPTTLITGDYSEALTHAVRAVQLRPELPIHHKNIAQIYSIR
jgi:hypothetical protein